MNWPLTFYVKSLSNGAKNPSFYTVGVANGPIVRILKTHKNDEGLYQHELVHVKQWFLTLGFHGLFYRFSDKYKLWSEVQAYKKQLKYYDNDRTEQFAGFIADHYKLSISKEAVIELLK